MQTLYANKDTTIRLMLEEAFSYYLLVFSQGDCIEHFEVVLAEDVCSIGTSLTLNVTLDMGVYNVAVYGQENYSNTSIQLATFVTSEQIQVYNPAEICFDASVLTDEYNYPLADENGEDLLA